MYRHLMNLLFPPKCVLCRAILTDTQTDLCHTCRAEAPVVSKTNFKLSFIARWTAVWYYKDNVRQSILRYKFYNARSYAEVYGRFLAMKLQTARMEDFDVLTWVPTGFFRRLRRGYDQVQLLANAVSKELDREAIPVLKKVRNRPPQSRIRDASKRRANVLNAYKVVDIPAVRGKRVLLLDDILTTGATASECAKILMAAGAQNVTFAAIAVASHEAKKK